MQALRNDGTFLQMAPSIKCFHGHISLIKTMCIYYFYLWYKFRYKLGMNMSPGFSKLVSLLRQFLLKLSVFFKLSLCCFVPSDSQDPFKCNKGLSSSKSATKKLIIDPSEKDVKTNGYF